MSERLAWCWCLLVALTLSIFLAFLQGAWAREVERGILTICDTQEQVKWMEVGATPETINSHWPLACGAMPLAYYRGKRVADLNNDRGLYAILVVAVNGQVGPPMVQFAALQDVGLIRVHEMPGVESELNKWYSEAETLPESRKRFPFPWQKCCNHAEVVDSKYIVRPDGKDGWRYKDPHTGKVKDVPLDIIHWGEVAPDKKATLFIYMGVMTCFYPPEGGL